METSPSTSVALLADEPDVHTPVAPARMEESRDPYWRFRGLCGSFTCKAGEHCNASLDEPHDPHPYAELWFSDSVLVKAQARLVCLEGGPGGAPCPVFNECREYIDRLERGQSRRVWFGVWAGEDVEGRGARRLHEDALLKHARAGRRTCSLCGRAEGTKRLDGTEVRFSPAANSWCRRCANARARERRQALSA